MKKMILAAMMVVLMFVLAGCQTHEHSTVTSRGMDSYGDQYTIVREYIDGTLVSETRVR